VTLGASVDGHRVILSGLTDGDQVITKGIAHIRPNMPVTPKQTDIVAAQSINHPEASIEPSAENTIEKE
jgi:multidrug efflux system membrane fusion protein